MNAADAQEKTAVKAKGKVLLLDDDKFLLDMYALKFTSEGYTVHACFSTDEALEVLHGDWQPDLVLFDITMPGKDGFNFLQTMHDDHLAKDALKIPLTNQSSDAEKEKAKGLGADDYFVKATMIPSEVVNKVGELLAKRGARA
jgi:CheY-like chemotaxis protein